MASKTKEEKLLKKLQDHEILTLLVKNPVAQIVAGTIVIECLQNWDAWGGKETYTLFGIPGLFPTQRYTRRAIVGEVMGTIAEIGLIAAVTAQQLGPEGMKAAAQVLAPVVGAGAGAVGGAAKLLV